MARRDHRCRPELGVDAGGQRPVLSAPRWATRRACQALTLWLATITVACASVSTTAPAPATSTGSSDEESFLIVIVGAEATSDGSALTISGVDPHVMTFADAPGRDVASEPIARFVADWSSAFSTRPNAVLSWNEGDASALVVLELAEPTWSDDRLVIPYQVLPDEGSFGDIAADAERRDTMPASMTDVRLFIDDCSSPFTSNGSC